MKKWFLEPGGGILLEVPRALAASVLAATLDFGILVLLVEVAGWHPHNASIPGSVAGCVLQYILCSVWVFSNAPTNKTVGFLAFALLSLGGLGITWIVMLGGESYHLPYTCSKVLALGLSFSWNFLSRKFLLFRPLARKRFGPAEALAVAASS